MPTQAEIEVAKAELLKRGIVDTFSVKAALEAAEHARWQPIETAPKDGSWVLVWWPSSNVRDAAWFQYPPDEPGRWTEGTGRPMAPTHWQSLPSPPESK